MEAQLYGADSGLQTSLSRHGIQWKIISETGIECRLPWPRPTALPAAPQWQA